MTKTYPDDETIHKNFRLNIMDLCYLNNINFKQLSERSGVKYDTIHNYTVNFKKFKGYVPNALTVIKIADYFDVSVHDILFTRVGVKK